MILWKYLKIYVMCVSFKGFGVFIRICWVFFVRIGIVVGVGSGREELVRRICYFFLFNFVIFGLFFNL